MIHGKLQYSHYEYDYHVLSSLLPAYDFIELKYKGAETW